MKKKLKGKEIAVLSFLLAVVLLLGGVTLWVAGRYRARGLELLAEFEGAYTFDGIHLFSPDGEQMMMFSSLPPEYFPAFEKKSADLSSYGFEGVTLSYFDLGGAMIVPDPAYEGFWTVSRTDRFVYLGEDGKKYGVNPQENVVYPIFSGSVAEVDPYGTDVVGFSANGTYAVGLREGKLTVYHTDPMDASFHIVDVKAVDVSSCGEISSLRFVSDEACYFVGEKEGKSRYYAVNLADGRFVEAPETQGEVSAPVDRIFAQALSVEREEKEAYPVVWVNRLLGEEKRRDLGEGVESARLLAVCPKGNLAVFEVAREGNTEHVVTGEKKSFVIESVLGDGERITGVTFCYENVLLVTVTKEERTVTRAYTVLFS